MVHVDDEDQESQEERSSKVQHYLVIACLEKSLVEDDIDKNGEDETGDGDTEDDEIKRKFSLLLLLRQTGLDHDSPLPVILCCRRHAELFVMQSYVSLPQNKVTILIEVCLVLAFIFWEYLLAVIVTMYLVTRSLPIPILNIASTLIRRHGEPHDSRPVSALLTGFVESASITMETPVLQETFVLALACRGADNSSYR